MKITSFGEVLWDIFPEHKKIGGAPLNVALRLHSMGIDSSIVTRIGNDDLGLAIKNYVEEQGLSSHTFQIDYQYRTGEVLVTLDNQNTATYKISQPVAWDFIEYSETIAKEIEQSDAIVFGSLACRNQVSRATLFRVLDKAKFKILDVNLRPPYYDSNLLFDVMKKADFIKMNDEELDEISNEFNSKAKSIEDKIKAVAEYTNTKQICITKGNKGATLYYNNSFYNNKGYKVKVVDTVGAGDSFLATLILGLLQGKEPQVTINSACVIGAMVVGSKGANPVFSKEEIDSFITKNKSF